MLRVDLSRLFWRDAEKLGIERVDSIKESACPRIDTFFTLMVRMMPSKIPSISRCLADAIPAGVQQLPKLRG
ncbi:MAG: hypothetical protein PW789_01045 [Edaphobacter sp.]|nr:hypothetical protein [Edaphobacter sp.]MDE1175176.1 hypothetical protein [Edaphobacter sp.]